MRRSQAWWDNASNAEMTATVNLPVIVLSGGPMLDGYYQGKRAGSGLVLWESRHRSHEGIAP